MGVDEFVEIGRILKPFGVKGEVKVRFYIDDESDLEGVEHFFIRDKKNGFRALDCTSLKFEESPEFAKASFTEIPDRTIAESWRQVGLYVPRSILSLPKGFFFISDLIGLDAGYQGVSIGIVDNHINVADTDMLVVKTSKDMLTVPMTEQYIEKIDTENRIVLFRNIDELF